MRPCHESYYATNYAAWHHPIFGALSLRNISVEHGLIGSHRCASEKSDLVLVEIGCPQSFQHHRDTGTLCSLTA